MFSLWFYARMRELPFVRGWRRRWRYKGIGAFLHSFPKAGRTWLRIALGKVLIRHFNLDAALNPMDLHAMAEAHPRIPRVKVDHEDDPHVRTPGELIRWKSEFADQKIIFLVRDPRDIVVSQYFRLSRQHDYYKGPISEFIRRQRGSLQTLVRYLNIWADARPVLNHFLVVKYESLHEDLKRELRRVLTFIDLPDISEAALDEAAQFTKFENMKEVEKKGEIQDKRFQPGDKNDPESFHTRRGKVGGYVDYLSPEDVAWVDNLVNSQLDPFYGYAAVKGAQATAGTSG